MYVHIITTADCGQYNLKYFQEGAALETRIHLAFILTLVAVSVNRLRVRLANKFVSLLSHWGSGNVLLVAAVVAHLALAERQRGSVVVQQFHGLLAA